MTEVDEMHTFANLPEEAKNWRKADIMTADISDGIMILIHSRCKTQFSVNSQTVFAIGS